MLSGLERRGRGGRRRVEADLGLPQVQIDDCVSESLFNRLICALISIAGVQLIADVNLIHVALAALVKAP